MKYIITIIAFFASIVASAQSMNDYELDTLGGSVVSIRESDLNTADMYDVTATNITGGVLTYNRRKTDSVRRDNAVMSVRLEPEAESLMERLKGRRQLLLFRERYADHRAFNNNINKGLKEIGGIIGVEGLTTYHARHTWATLARNVCGVDFDTVSRALNHATRGTDKVTDIYVDKDWSKVWDANRRVLDAVFGK